MPTATPEFLALVTEMVENLQAAADDFAESDQIADEAASKLAVAEADATTAAASFDEAKLGLEAAVAALKNLVLGE